MNVAKTNIKLSTRVLETKDDVTSHVFYSATWLVNTEDIASCRIWLPSDEVVVKIDCFMHYNVYGLLETIRQEGSRKRCRRILCYRT